MPLNSLTEHAARLSPLDLAVVGAYLVGITIFGLRFAQRGGGQKGSSLKTYFLADNAIPWWAIALSIVSAETSTLTIVSIPGVAFAGDMGFLQVVLGYMLGRVVVAALFLPKYFRGEMLTAYQLIDRRFGPVLHKVTAGLFLLTRAAAEGVRVFAISIVVSIAIGTGDTLSIAIISALTLLYTFEGGMAAVIWTDVVQMALYVAGTLIALFTLGAQVPGGWGQIHAVAAPLGKFHVLNLALNLTQSYTFWAGVLGGTFLTMASHGTDQLMVQRMLAARNLRESRLALLSSGVVIFLQFTLFLLIGVGLFVFYGAHPPAFRSNDYIFPTFIVQLMPHGIAGLLVAAILAAAMSNLSAALNSLASTTVIDFYVPWRARGGRGGETRTTLVSRVSTVFWAVVLFAIAVYSIRHGGKGHVVETGLSIASVAYGCLLGVFLLGTLTRYATQWGVIGGMVCGFALNLWLWKGSFPMHLVTPFGLLEVPHIAFTWYVLIGSLATFALGSLFSVLFGLGKRRTVVVGLAVLLLPLGLRGQVPGQPTPVPVVPPGGVAAPTFYGPSSYSETRGYDFSAVSALVNAAIAEHKLPGAVVLVGHDGKVVFEHAYGYRKLVGEPGLDGNPSAAEPMTEDTIFDMASLTKVLVTTTAILQLYEQKKLELDAPVAKYLPEFGVNGKERITVRQLLTHYSGLPEDVNLKDDWGLKTPDKAEGIRRAIASVPYGPSGQTFKYSDVNFITLGALVEKVSGVRLDYYAQQSIFLPLKMTTTRFHSFDQVCGPSQATGSVIGFEPYPIPSPDDQPLGSRAKYIICLVPAPDQGPALLRWEAATIIPQTSPTAHDNEGIVATNPNFDHLLRGTVHDPTARRMGGVAGHAGVFSTAGDMSIFCQALLEKLVYNVGPFPLSQATLQVATSPQAPPRAVKTATIFTPDGQTTTGVAQRGLGWDINSAYSRPRGEVFPIATGGYGKPGHAGSFGHTGFTGTSLWLDPTSNTYVIVLANAIHPRVPASGNLSTLRGQVATAAARALGLSLRTQAALVPAQEEQLDAEMMESGIARPSYPATTGEAVNVASAGGRMLRTAFQAAPAKTLSGIDVLESTHFAALKTLASTPGHPVKLGLLTNQAGIDSQSRRTIDVLFEAGKMDSEVELTTIFTPEHGLFARQDTEHLTAETDAATHLPVLSLYGAKAAERHAKQADLKKLDALVIDLPDAGVRFWTYETVLGYMLEDCARAKVPVIVLDRPDPIGGAAVQGPMSDVGSESYINFMSLPVRHGMTMGELARFFNANATEVQLDPKLLDARAVTIGSGAADDASGNGDKPPATRPGLHAALTVIPMQNWHRSEFFAETGLPWVPPSPNMKTPATNIVYPGIALMETTNMSVGRGSPAPYENFGAPFVKADELAAYLNARNLTGVSFTASSLTIVETSEKYPYHGEIIPAIHINVTNAALLDTPEMGVEILSALYRLYPKEFQLEKAKTILLNAATLNAIKAGQDPRDIAASWSASLQAFRAQRASALLYR